MPLVLGSLGVGGGGGRALGPETNTFGTTATADRATAEGLRDAYQGANAAWLALYNADRSNLILLQWDDGEALQRRNVAGTGWEDATEVVVGPRGPGPTNAQIVSAFDGAGRHSTFIYDATAYDVADARLRITTDPSTASPRAGDVVWAAVPAGVPRTEDEIAVRINGVDIGPLQTTAGANVKPRQLTQGRVHGLLVLTGAARIVDELPSARAQDWQVAAFWSDENLDTEAVIAAQFAGLATSATAAVAVPAYVAGTRASSAYLFLGVPTDAPSIVRVASHEESVDLRLSVEPVPSAEFAGQVGGADYRWVRSVTRQSFAAGRRWGEGRTIRLAYEYL